MSEQGTFANILQGVLWNITWGSGKVVSLRPVHLALLDTVLVTQSFPVPSSR